MDLRLVRHFQVRGVLICCGALAAALLLALAPARASAASPVLEFAPSGGAFPVDFVAEGGEVTAAMTGIESVVRCKESEGEGRLTGPQTAIGTYWFYGCETEGGTEDNRECRSVGAEPGEIESEEINANLVFISQARHEVGMVLAPQNEMYMTFSCEGTVVTAYGPFVSPVGPINQSTSEFTATLTSAGANQLPNSYEAANGAVIPAVPMGSWKAGTKVPTGVNLAFDITTYPPFGLTPLPLEIRARTAAEVEADERKRQEAEAAEKKRQEDAAAAAKRQQEEAAAAEAKKHAEEEALRRAEAKKRQLRAQRLQKALKQCRRLDSKQKRAKCIKKARNKYGVHKKGKQGSQRH